MDTAGLRDTRKRHTRSEEMPLPDYILEPARPQPFGQRRAFALERVIRR
jgi:hypothetical protein